MNHNNIDMLAVCLLNISNNKLHSDQLIPKLIRKKSQNLSLGATYVFNFDSLSFLNLQKY